MSEYIELNRCFRDLTDQDRKSPEITLYDDGELDFGIPWNELLKSERVLILAEGGSGKTCEMKEQKKKLSNKGHFAFFIPNDILDKHDIRDSLSLEPDEVEKFDTWLSDNSQPAYFFLDAVDELKLINGKFEISLKKLAKTLGRACARSHIFISCRPTDWLYEYDLRIFKEILPVSESSAIPELTSKEAFLRLLRPTEEKKKQKDQIKKFRCVVLKPLEKNRIGLFVRAKGISNPEALLEEINSNQSWLFVRRPLDLERIIKVWKANEKLGSLRQQHEMDVKASLEDNHNHNRPARILSMNDAIDGAERLALAMLLTKSSTFQSQEQSIENISTSINAFDILSDWSPDKVNALLRCPIFDPAIYGQVRFHHRSIQEFLAALRLEKLHKKGLPKHKLLRIFFKDIHGERVVIPSRSPIAAWLAMNNPDICQELLRREPEILILYGDPETLPLSVRDQLVKSYVNAYGNGKWRGLRMPIAEIQRLASPDLSSTIKTFWSQSFNNEEVKTFLLKLIWLGKILDCTEIAFEAAVNTDLGDYVRLIGIRALGACKKNDSLKKIICDIFTYPKRWSARLIHSSISDFFPDIISVAELMQLIRETPEPTRAAEGFSWELYKLVENLDPGTDVAVSLRNFLVELIWEGREATERWDNSVSKYSYLAPTLIKLCQRRAGLTPLDEKWIYASTIGTCFHNDNTLGREVLEELVAILTQQLPYRKIAFWFEKEIRDVIDSSPQNDVAYNLLYDQKYSVFGQIVADDWDWLIEDIQKENPLLKRKIALQSLFDPWVQRGKLKTDLHTLKQAIKDNKDLKKIIKGFTSFKPEPTLLDLTKEDELYSKSRINKQQEEEEQTLLTWKTTIEADPKGHFQGEHLNKTRMQLIQLLRFHEDTTDLVCNQWKKVRRIFGNAIGNLFEQDLKNYWRETKPPIWSQRLPEDHNKIYFTQYAALTGLTIEAANDSNWIDSLSSAHAQRAAEWGLTELNRMPEWYSILVRKRPTLVKNALSVELQAELKDVLTPSSSRVLNMVKYSDLELKILISPNLRIILIQWPHPPTEQATENIYNQKLSQVLSIVTAATPEDKDIVDLCEERFLATPDYSSAIIWLRGLFSCNPKRGIEVLNSAIKTLPKTKRKTRVVTWFGKIFGDYNSFNIKLDIIEPKSLASLTKLAYEYIQPNEDVQHTGVYTPDIRDNAKQARNFLLETLIEKSGFEAYQALAALADDPLFTDMADRLRIIARQRAAKDSEPSGLSVKDYKKWEEIYEISPRNRDELFQIISNRLHDIQYDISHHDFSDRHILEKIQRETEIQPLLAKKLEDTSRGQYFVSREDEVINKKKPDIRISAVNADYRCVIEIKIGNKWTIKQLENAIKEQLVNQYLRYPTCSAGFLLVTYTDLKGKGFRDPETKKSMTFEDVIERLKKYAISLEDSENGRIKIGIFPLDLRMKLQTSHNN